MWLYWVSSILLGGGVPAVGGKGGPVLVLVVSRVVSLRGATFVLRFGNGGSGLADIWWVLSGDPFWYHFRAGGGIIL